MWGWCRSPSASEIPPIPPPIIASFRVTGVDELVEVPSGTGKVTGSSGTDATAEVPFGIAEE